MILEDKLFLAKEEDGGFTWTLATFLGDMILECENLFGVRDRSYTLLGIDFAEESRIWFPGNCKHIIIHVEINSKDKLEDICFEIAFNVVHALSPRKLNEINNLERGLSLFFAEFYMNKTFGDGFWNYQRVDEIERKCLQCVEKILEKDIYAIKKIRRKHKCISLLEAKDILEFVDISYSEEVEFLCRKFVCDTVD
jgi:hypothetical protein